MSLSSLDDLFVLAQETPFLEKLHKSLRQEGNFGNQLTHQWLTQRQLPRLLQDAGVQIDREMIGYDPAEPAPGPETARLNAEYTPVDQKRVRQVLQSAYEALNVSRMKDEEKAGMKRSLTEIMEKFGI